MATQDPTGAAGTLHPADDQSADILRKLRRTFGGADEVAATSADLFAVASHAPLEESEGALGAFESDCCDWGAVYGFAYALVREQSGAWDTLDSITERAGAIAATFWGEWSGDGFEARA